MGLKVKAIMRSNSLYQFNKKNLHVKRSIKYTSTKSEQIFRSSKVYQISITKPMSTKFSSIQNLNQSNKLNKNQNNYI